MKEYEYSYNVKSLNKILSFCENNNFKFLEKSEQERTIYRNDNKTMARITKNVINGVLRYELDFKEDNYTQDLIKNLRESESLEFSNVSAVYSILEFLGYKKDNTLIRTRYIYETDGVKFELDEYVKPKETCVISFEGEKCKVDEMFKILKEKGIYEN